MNVDNGSTNLPKLVAQIVVLVLLLAWFYVVLAGTKERSGLR